MPGRLPVRLVSPGEICAFSADSGTEKFSTRSYPNFAKLEEKLPPVTQDLWELLCASPPRSSEARLTLVGLVASSPQARDYGRIDRRVCMEPQSWWAPEELLKPLPHLARQFGVAASATGCCWVVVVGPGVAAEEMRGRDRLLSGGPWVAQEQPGPLAPWLCTPA